MTQVIATTGSVSAITTRLVLRAGADRQFATWQAAFTRAVTGCPGFLSVEIIPAAPDSPDWRIVQRFRSPGQLDAWRRSPARDRLIAEIDPLLEGGRGGIADESAPDFHSLGSVTEVISTLVKPEKQEEFRAWCNDIQAAQGGFPGYVGTYVQAPTSAEQPSWTTLVRFSTPERLDAWLSSPERHALLQRSEALVQSWQSRRLPTSFAGWFPTGPDQAAPPTWKQAALVLLVLYPVVMLELRFLSPLLAGLNPALGTFIGNTVSVALVSWPLMPMAVYFLSWWLQPAPRSRTRAEVPGLLLVTALYLLELLGLWRLL
jgi:antibiotic biosynthesis monooxygenase (ABM) superfamily enzyme